ncbi:MAG TPA: hypothetical protein ENF83_00590 [Candidatus Korarchaeota archaeon]|nr:hypothetical protein [Candidatus Korarchaeota archaeon]
MRGASEVRVAVAAEGPEGLDAVVSYTFGRAPYFVLVEVVEGRISGATSHSNPYADAPSAAGPSAAQFVASLGAQVAIAGDFGINAVQALMSLGVQPVSGYAGMRVRDAVEAYLQGGPRLPPPVRPPSPTPTTYPLSVPATLPQPPQPIPPPPTPPVGVALSREEEIRLLKEQKRWIEERLRQIEERLRELDEQEREG